eukprot:scaffold28678_cov111-Isochrysis_galbana.AAC.5
MRDPASWSPLPAPPHAAAAPVAALPADSTPAHNASSDRRKSAGQRTGASSSSYGARPELGRRVLERGEVARGYRSPEGPRADVGGAEIGQHSQAGRPRVQAQQVVRAEHRVAQRNLIVAGLSAHRGGRPSDRGGRRAAARLEPRGARRTSGRPGAGAVRPARPSPAAPCTPPPCLPLRRTASPHTGSNPPRGRPTGPACGRCGAAGPAGARSRPARLSCGPTASPPRLYTPTAPAGRWRIGSTSGAAGSAGTGRAPPACSASASPRSRCGAKAPGPWPGVPARPPRPSRAGAPPRPRRHSSPRKRLRPPRLRSSQSLRSYSSTPAPARPPSRSRGTPSCSRPQPASGRTGMRARCPTNSSSRPPPRRRRTLRAPGHTPARSSLIHRRPWGRWTRAHWQYTRPRRTWRVASGRPPALPAGGRLSRGTAEAATTPAHAG